MNSGENTKKKWSILTYMAGDNNLSPEGLADVIEMEKAGSSDLSNVIVEMDAHTEDFQGSYRWEITPKDPRTNTGPRKVMQQIKEQDSGDPNTLKSFLTWGKELYPAEKHVVVLWNHGSGFRLRGGGRYLTSPRAGTERAGIRKPLFSRSPLLGKLTDAAKNILSDDMTRNSVDMIELGNALGEAGFVDNNKIDILGFDACLMNMLEVAYEMRNFAKFIVGSEELEPGKGWPYTLDVELFNKAEGNSPEEIVQKLVKNYGDFYNQPSERHQWPITQSAIDLSHIEGLAECMGGFGNALAATLPGAMPKLSEIREQVQYYAASADYDDYCDLVDFANLCMTNMDDENVKAAAKEVISNAKNVVKAEVHYGDDVSRSYGLTCWCPETASKYRNNIKAYELLAMTKKHDGWNKFLATYHAPSGVGEKKLLGRSELDW